MSRKSGNRFSERTCAKVHANSRGVKSPNTGPTPDRTASAKGPTSLTIRARMAITSAKRGYFARVLFRPQRRPILQTHNPTVKKPVRICPTTGLEREEKMFAVIKTGGKQY